MVGRVVMIVAVVYCGGRWRDGVVMERSSAPHLRWHRLTTVCVVSSSSPSRRMRVVLLTNAMPVGCGGEHEREVAERWQSNSMLAAQVSDIVCRCVRAWSSTRKRWRGGGHRKACSMPRHTCMHAVAAINTRKMEVSSQCVRTCCGGRRREEGGEVEVTEQARKMGRHRCHPLLWQH